MLLEDKTPKTEGMLATRLLEIFPELMDVCANPLYSTKYSASVEESRYFRPTLVMSEVPAVVREYQPKVTQKSHPHLFRLIA